MKHFTKQNSSLCILHGTIGIQINNIVYTSKQKHYQFSSKNSSATKNSPQSNVYYMEFFLNFLFEYSFIGIVKLKFTRRNEMWCRILEIEDLSKKVRKTQDRTSLRVVKYGKKIYFNIFFRKHYSNFTEFLQMSLPNRFQVTLKYFCYLNRL